jgi:tetratricopeptide (TPR) repeat protein
MTDFKGDETFRNRLTMWHAAYLMLKDPAEFPQRLIFGGGFGFFEVNYLPYQTEVLETYDFNTWFHNVIPTFRAHNDHLQMLVEAGLIGTSLYVLIFVTFFMFGFRFLREEEDPARRLFALGVLGAAASLVAIAFFSFPLHEIEHGGLLFTVMGMMVAEICQRNRKRVETNDLEKTALPEPESKGGKRKARKAAPVQAANIETWPKEFFITIWKRVPLVLSAPLIAVVLFLTTWGVYTQIINFKSQYFVVKGIATLRGLDGSLPENARLAYAQMAANFFFQAYQLDPTNGRAEFFNGFALTKKATYEDTVAGVQALEEGQLLYPQSDTFYALALGYEVRQRLAQGRAQELQTQIQTLKDQNPVPPDRTQYVDDAQMSQNKAIDAYMTAAKYYPVKVEYYKELLKLLEAQGRWEEIIPWAERALVVDNWLLKKPPIRWQLYLWLGKAHRAIGAQQIQSGDIQAGLESWSKAETALLEAKKLSNAIYYSYYELGQIYEALGELAQRDGDTSKAMEQFSKARDQYVDVFKWKANVPSGSSPFDYAYLLLARIYEKLGDTDRALTYYRGLMNESLYSNNTETYQKAREKVHELTGNWEGQPPTGQVQQEAGKGEPSDWIGTQQ